MSVTVSPPDFGSGEQCLVLYNVGWASYVAANDAFAEKAGLHMVFVDGRLTFSTCSRCHEWYTTRLADLIKAIADGVDFLWETAGRSTFRVEGKRCGVEGDATFYFGDHAEALSGPQEIDLTTQPPPDLAVQVEVGHAEDDAVAVWGRIGVPEVWRWNPAAWSFSIWRLRGTDGEYERTDASLGLPRLTAADVLAQMRDAAGIGFSRWRRQLPGWVAETLLPRLEEGRSRAQE